MALGWEYSGGGCCLVVGLALLGFYGGGLVVGECADGDVYAYIIAGGEVVVPLGYEAQPSGEVFAVLYGVVIEYLGGVRRRIGMRLYSMRSPIRGLSNMGVSRCVSLLYMAVSFVFHASPVTGIVCAGRVP